MNQKSTKMNRMREATRAGMPAGTVTDEAARVTVTGIVQGVGFRPFVHRLATELGLRGHVGNDSTSVLIEVAGSRNALDGFIARLRTDAPPLAFIEEITRVSLALDELEGASDFGIAESHNGEGPRTLIPPDAAVCDDCLRELFDASDRRYRHPFITCTNCGPRFTIIRNLPYDRRSTTMAHFAMCPTCEAEYHDPLNRRHHAQPIACWDCGPELTLHTQTTGAPDTSKETGERAITSARRALTSTRIVAIKGIGGFHLACNASDEGAIHRLRDAKHRPDKPFAIMVRSIDQAEALAHINDAERALLLSCARPIVLLEARAGTNLASNVTPGNPLIGIMLAYSPLHHLLLEGDMPPLVMTSGNLGGEPIAYADTDAAMRLGDMSDAILTHDRPIHMPCDDSVVRVANGRLLPVRRARGYAPVPVRFPHASRHVLATGGELKNTFCVSTTEHAWTSQHIGDMENLETLDTFRMCKRGLASMYDVTPAVVATDAHPGYLTHRWAREHHPEKLLKVQHHHAHIASVLAEHRLHPAKQVIGMAFDGTGFGDDGTVWGGEVLIANAFGFTRFAHLEPVSLPGGDAAVRNPYRVALSYLLQAGIEWAPDIPAVAATTAGEQALLHRQLERNIATVPSSSMGRLFDAVASILGLRHAITYEAQAAIDLEISALRHIRSNTGSTKSLCASPLLTTTDSQSRVVATKPIFSALVNGLRRGTAIDALAAAFHNTISDIIVECAIAARNATGHEIVALSGGVFQNALLTDLSVRALERAGFTALTNNIVPCNDGGLALGQAFVAAHTHQE